MITDAWLLSRRRWDFHILRVWIADPARRLINVFLPDNKVQATLTADDTLTGGDLLPGFSIHVKTIFE